MNWSKVKHDLIEERFSPKLGRRLGLNTTRYTTGSHWMARSWMTIDGHEIANFSTPDHHARFGHSAPDWPERIAAHDRTPGQAVEKGEFAHSEFLDACYLYLQSSIDSLWASPHPLLRALAMLDRRVGRRRLLGLDPQGLHPLAARLWQLRLEVEGWPLPQTKGQA